jgi:prepilin-type N-terminal cleavage/methylation domain-containing protein
MKRSTRGYTLVEVMTAVVVMTIGATGILAMQGASVHSNQDAQETATAVNFGTTWLERVKRDARLWVAPGNAALATTSYLRRGVPTTETASAWFVPVRDATDVANSLQTFGSPAANLQGFDVYPVNGAYANVFFCANLRMTVVHAYNPLGPSVNPLSDADSVRVDVRVWWPRASVDTNRTRACVPNALTDDEVKSSAFRKHHLSSVVRWRAVGWP